MAIFTGTNKKETITTEFVSPSVSVLAVLGDPLLPSAAADRIDAGGGNDRVEAGGGADEIKLGGGDDKFFWKEGDGEDALAGNGGFDTLKFAGGVRSDLLLLSTEDGKSLAALRDEGVRITGIERIDFALGEGEDSIFLGPLAGSGIKQVVVDLSPLPADTTGDGERDEVNLDGNNRDNDITVAEAGAGIKVKGLAADVTVKNADAGLDALAIKGFGGDDRIDASALPADSTVLSLFGGDGNDTMIGGRGDDRIEGERGRDTLKGGRGDDVFAFLDDKVSSKADRILDFKVGDDLIGLGDGFSSLGGAVDESEFRVGAKAGDANDFLIYDPKTGKLFYDEDGNGSGKAIGFATLDKGLALSADDFGVSPPLT